MSAHAGRKALREPISLSEASDDADASMEGMFETDGAWEKYAELNDVERVQHRFCHADCDDFAFALHALTGWDVVGFDCPRNGFIHRAARAPDGRILDAGGWSTIEDLRKRYRSSRLRMVEWRPDQGMLDDDADLARVLSAMLHLPHAPFDEPDFQRQVREWIAHGVCLDDEEQPQPRLAA